MLLIGSQAMLANGIITGRKPSDFDFVCTYEEMTSFLKRVRVTSVYPINSGKTFFAKTADGHILEFSIAWGVGGECRESNLLAFAYDRNNHGTISYRNRQTIFGVCVDVASAELLLLLKESHKYLKNSPHFLKTMADIKLLRKCGVKIPANWAGALQARERLTYAYSHPNLHVSKEKFFDPTATGIKQKYDHDSVHEAVALTGVPAYKLYMKDGEAVACDREKFEALDDMWKLLGVIEESMVLAIERSLVPFPGAMSPDDAFAYALSKVCTSITSGWFREWAWENHDNAMEFYRANDLGVYWTSFQIAVNESRVKLNPQH